LTYRLKKPDRRGNTVTVPVLSPQELLVRLCSLIPAPRHPTRRYFGILAERRKGPQLRGAQGHAPQKRARASGAATNDDDSEPWVLDALECPRCKGGLTAMAVVENAEAIARYLAHTGQATVHPRAQGWPDLAA